MNEHPFIGFILAAMDLISHEKVGKIKRTNYKGGKRGKNFMKKERTKTG